MALPSSGALSMADIAGEFGGSTPHSLSEYYGAASGIPSSGAISIADFYGASSYISQRTITLDAVLLFGSWFWMADSSASGSGSGTGVPYAALPGHDLVEMTVNNNGSFNLVFAGTVTSSDWSSVDILINGTTYSYAYSALTRQNEYDSDHGMTVTKYSINDASFPHPNSSNKSVTITLY